MTIWLYPDLSEHALLPEQCPIRTRNVVLEKGASFFATAESHLMPDYLKVKQTSPKIKEKKNPN